jgi:hypothetical protein
MEDKAKLQVVNTDPFDLESLRLDQNFDEEIGVKKLLTNVKVRKPHRQEFIRVHPDDAYRLDMAIVHLKEEREYFPVTRSVAPLLRQDDRLKTEIRGHTLFTTINRQGVPFLWPIPIEDGNPDGRGSNNDWNRSAREAAERAMGDVWVRVAANMDAGLYDVFEAQTHSIPDPIWPDYSFQEIMRIAFKDRIIADLDHPVAKQLRGEV